METLLQDLRYALRMCVRAPGFTSVAVVALALGIGANTAIFTIVNAALIERLPFKDPARLVVIWEESARRPGRANVVGPMNYVRWRERAQSFEGMAGFVDTRANLTGNGAPEELAIQNVTAGFLDVAGVEPMIGRGFSDEESADPNSRVVILSYPLWQRRFGSDAAIVGRAIQLNGAPATVIGVMPPGIPLLMKSNSLVGKPIELWTTWVLPPNARDLRGRYMSVLARLKPGVSLQQARTEMNAISAALAAELPAMDTGWTVRVLSIRDELAGDLRPALLMLAGAVGFVLLIACANVANLLLARGAARQKEIAIRGALGAARSRVIRQLLTEALVLAIAGGAAGILVAQWTLSGMLALSPVDLTALGPVELNYTVLTFTAVVSLATAVISGFAPAFEGSRTDVQESLKDGARQVGSGVRHRRLRQAFVVAEIALAVVLLAGAGLMLRSFATLRSVDPGFDTHNVLTARVALPGRKYDTPDKSLRFFEQAVKRIESLPGVESAGKISFLPFTGVGAGTGFTIVGQPPPPPGQDYITDVSVCDNGYFQTMKVPLVRGRFFTEREMLEKSNVVIVNEALARRYFPAGDVLGQKLIIEMTDRDQPTEIIGVVANSKFADLRTETRAAVYWPHPQLAYNAMTLAVRTASDPLTAKSLVEREIQQIDKDQPISDVRTMDQWVARTLSQARFSSSLLMVFASLALVLAAIGIYAVMSYAVSQRTSEIGIRLALGAERSDILRLIVGNGIRLAVVGLATGTGLALALSRTISSLLFETASADLLTFVAVVVLLGAVAVFASWLPAHRASRIAPTEALRYQ
jgi:putative ABC transport system permease protein